MGGRRRRRQGRREGVSRARSPTFVCTASDLNGALLALDQGKGYGYECNNSLHLTAQLLRKFCGDSAEIRADRYLPAQSDKNMLRVRSLTFVCAASAEVLRRLCRDLRIIFPRKVAKGMCGDSRGRRVPDKSRVEEDLNPSSWDSGEHRNRSDLWPRRP